MNNNFVMTSNNFGKKNFIKKINEKFDCLNLEGKKGYFLENYFIIYIIEGVNDQGQKEIVEKN